MRSSILAYTASHTLESFTADTRTIDAVVRNLEVIGEAARHLDAGTAEQLSQIPWRELQAMRNVLIHEEACRVTRVSEPRHLKASDIKPWRNASDAERLDGANGLLLSPHIDHLFDDGYITFSRNQELVIVPEVRDKLLDAWGIDAGVRVGEFTREQNAYLEYHRVNVFKHALLHGE